MRKWLQLTYVLNSRKRLANLNKFVQDKVNLWKATSRERERYSTRISNTLTDLMPLVPFYTPWKRLNLWFFMLSGGYRKNQRHKRGSFPKLQNILVHPKIIFKYQDSLMLSTHFFDSRLITDFKSSRPEVFLKILGWGL